MAKKKTGKIAPLTQWDAVLNSILKKNVKLQEKTNDLLVAYAEATQVVNELRSEYSLKEFEYRVLFYQFSDSLSQLDGAITQLQAKEGVDAVKQSRDLLFQKRTELLGLSKALRKASDTSAAKELVFRQAEDTWLEADFAYQAALHLALNAYKDKVVEQAVSPAIKIAKKKAGL